MLTPEQKIIQVLVEQLMHWATPGKHPPGSEDYWQAYKSQDIVKLVIENKAVYPFNTAD